MCKALLTEESIGAEVELCPYLYDAFGNATRIDYGTGHETTFMIFMCTLAFTVCIANALSHPI
jgi:serine/threonine-protein phosphatase 2A activator